MFRDSLTTGTQGNAMNVSRLQQTTPMLSPPGQERSKDEVSRETLRSILVENRKISAGVSTEP